MKQVHYYIAMAIAIPILMTTLSYNIQLFHIQAFAQSNFNNNNNFSHTSNTKDVLNTVASNQKVVLRGIESSKIFNNATLNTGEKPQGVSILTNRPDGTIYTGIVTFTATKPVEVGISNRLPINNNTFSQIDTKTLGNLYTGYHNDKGEAGTPGILSTASVIVPDYGTHSPYFSASIPFVGDSLWLRTINGEPFIVAYSVSADIVQPLNVLNLSSAINATKGNTTFSSQ
jgi:hypothetical protein